MEAATQSQIQDWKAKYGEHSLSQVIISGDNDGKHEFIIRRPGRRELDAIGRHGANNEADKVNNTLINNCVLHGDKTLLDNNGAIYLRLIAELTKLMSQSEAEVKKL